MGVADLICQMEPSELHHKVDVYVRVSCQNTEKHAIHDEYFRIWHEVVMAEWKYSTLPPPTRVSPWTVTKLTQILCTLLLTAQPSRGHILMQLCVNWPCPNVEWCECIYKFWHVGWLGVVWKPWSRPPGYKQPGHASRPSYQYHTRPGWTIPTIIPVHLQSKSFNSHLSVVRSTHTVSYTK